MAEALKTDIPEHVFLGKFFEGYPRHCEIIPSSWVVWNDKESKEFLLRACHAELATTKGVWTDMITAVPFNDENSLEYLRMLIRGPFRSLSDLIRLERFDKNHALLLSGLDRWPANVLMNFCIASRVPIEFKPFIEPWAKLCELGYDPTLAFLIVYSRGYKVHPYSFETCNPNETILPRSFQVDRGGHMWIDPSTDWQNVIKGNIVKPSALFNENPEEACPTNIIWGVSDDYKIVQKLTDEEVVSYFTSRIQVLTPPPMWKPPTKKKKPPAYIGAGYGLQVQNMLQAAAPAGLQAAAQHELNMIAWHNAMQNHIVHDGPDPGPPPQNPHPVHPDQAHLVNPAAEMIVQPNGAWGLAEPDEPQPQAIGMVDEVEPEEDDGFPDDWDAEPVNLD